MTEYVFNRLKKLADNFPHWENCIEYWGEDPNKEQEAIRKFLAPVLLNGTLINPSLRMMTNRGETAPVFSFKVKGDPVEYIMFAMLDPNGLPHVAIAKSQFLNPQLN